MTTLSNYEIRSTALTQLPLSGQPKRKIPHAPMVSEVMRIRFAASFGRERPAPGVGSTSTSSGISGSVMSPSSNIYSSGCFNGMALAVASALPPPLCMQGSFLRTHALDAAASMLAVPAFKR
eukprot:CAMPEP_0180640932 /NCGR_PEP_ID=MMETSP1037_2-20121125/46161_1 /TAXON_ID=632150 /ORGANISM="Azadinium spinosum, Strain 3D9" /LENGTH=121 /DNA_ID=CAMNT_0022663639 /DNA_START=113 /DNA_END=478 /DNA_ORIENTATION=+